MWNLELIDREGIVLIQPELLGLMLWKHVYSKGLKVHELN